MKIIREKDIKSGKILEAEFYPVFPSGRRVPERKRPTREEQKNLNDANARKKIVRLINANFDEGDIVIHGTYRDTEMPESLDQVRRDLNNYIRRLRGWRRRHGLDDLKYIYVIEAKVSKRTGILRWHYHMVASGMDRDVAEQLWRHGDWTNANRLQPNEFGLEGIAKYLVKSPVGGKRWAQSKNLKQPTERKRDGKTSSRKLQRMCTQLVDDAGYWERRYKGYRLLKAEPKYNDYNGCWYLYVTLRRRE